MSKHPYDDVLKFNGNFLIPGFSSYLLKIIKAIDGFFYRYYKKSHNKTFVDCIKDTVRIKEPSIFENLTIGMNHFSYRDL